MSRRAAVKRTKGCAARNGFAMTGSFDRFVPGRNATTLSAMSFRAQSETNGERCGTRARFGAGAAAGVVMMLPSAFALLLVANIDGLDKITWA